MRYKCICSYDGSLFHGFQVQEGLRTVQSEIETTLKNVLKSDIVIYASGRTDASVHAIGQVFHFDCELDMTASQMKRAINSYLPKDIFIKEVEIVDEAFHSRFSAVSKEYHYNLDSRCAHHCAFRQYNRTVRIQYAACRSCCLGDHEGWRRKAHRDALSV